MTTATAAPPTSAIESAATAQMNPYRLLATPSVTEAMPIAQSGDFILTHSAGIYGGLIRFGEALRYSGKDKVFAHRSHAAIFVDEDGNIVEALGSGVQKRNISVYRGTEYVVLHLPAATASLDRKEAVEFAEVLPQRCIWLADNRQYRLVPAYRGKVQPWHRRPADMLGTCCPLSGANRRDFSRSVPWHLMPADLAKHFDVRLTGDKGKPPHPDAGVMRFSKPGSRRR
jgi:hypothetical protein